MRALLLVMSLVTPVLIPAQGVRGRVVDSTGAGVPRALVELLRPDGAVVGRVPSGSRGGFAIMSDAAGSRTLRLRAIGYSPLSVGPLLLEAGGYDVGDLRLAPLAVSLADLEVRESARCGGGGGGTISRLLDGARTSLDVMQANLAAGDGFAVRMVRRTAIARMGDSVVTIDTLVSPRVRWPIEALDPDSIRAAGFMVPGPVAGGIGYRWFGPDVRVLFADWFLADHCFRVMERGAKDATITVRFEPLTGGKRVEIAGTLMLDAATLALRRLTFEHRNLPRGVPGGSAGGAVEFAERGDGAWLPQRWRIHAPVMESGLLRARGRSDLVGELIGGLR